MIGNRKSKMGITLVSVVLFCCASILYAGVPEQITYQGQLTDTTGNPVPDGDYEMSFSLYGAGGSLLWDEQQSVVVTEGIYNVQLGAVSPLDVNVFSGDTVYLGVAIYNAGTTEWEILSPRQRLTSTAYAFQAENAQSLEGYGSADFAPALHEHSGDDITAGIIDEVYIDPDIARYSEITWSNLSGIPADIADGDQVGITAETDPTVDSSVKDGVSWSELSGIPAGFADGVDNVGLTEGSDYGRSGVASTLYEGTTALSTKYVGKSGSQTITNGNLTVNTSYGIGSTPVTGIKGSAQSDTYGFGIIGETTGSQGYGVYGEATNTAYATNYGGYFVANGATGHGVHAEASGEYAEGVYGEASGLSGKGVYGEATNTEGGVNYGGYFVASGIAGYGVHAEASGSSGRGVFGFATNTGDATNYGGYFVANGTTGHGVHSRASNTGDVTNYGGYFTASGSYGRGVYGEAWPTGNYTNHGGFFIARGTTGRGVYGEGSGASGRGVYGKASNDGDVTNYGGYFVAEGSYGRGVYGSGGQYDFYAANGSYSPFTGSHEIRLAEDMPLEIRAGMIVSVTGRAEAREKDDGEISLSSTLPTVALAKKAMDKAVFGVFVSECPLPEDHWYEAGEGERFGAVNALGEGRVLVTNITGTIEAGDYITTSAIPGYGQKQDDDLLHSYTLGKAIETVDWESVSETIEYNGVLHKVYLIAVAYTSG